VRNKGLEISEFAYGEESFYRYSGSMEVAARRALADEHRLRIVGELRSEPEGLDVRELGRRLSLHENTVRWHLGILDDAGFLESRPAANGRPGRPKIVYFLRPGAHEPEGRDEHRLLATILTGTVAGLPDGEQRAEEAGRAWGHFLVRTPSPLERVSDEEAVSEVTRLLDQQGFAAQAHGSEIHMRRCPFHDLAETNPEIVCGVHRGLLSGALTELGSDLAVEGLDVFVRPDLCVARLRRRDPGGGQALAPGSGERELPERLDVREADAHEA
jgi:predicted ArsR family transcriptional regulator